MGNRLLTTEDVAAQLHVKPTTVWKYVKERGLPAYKVGWRLLFDPAELENWLKTYTRVPGTEPTRTPDQTT